MSETTRRRAEYSKNDGGIQGAPLPDRSAGCPVHESCGAQMPVLQHPLECLTVVDLVIFGTSGRATLRRTPIGHVFFTTDDGRGIAQIGELKVFRGWIRRRQVAQQCM
jgi:hypothetical protein